MDLKNRLREIAAGLPPELVFRDIILDGESIARASGDGADELAGDLRTIDFTDKTVVDLGCNFGQYCFLAKQQGALFVVGVDIDERVIEGARILARLEGIDDVTFIKTDFLDATFGGTFDIAMLLDMIGKGGVVKGKLPEYLNAATRLAVETVIISARWSYPLADLPELSRENAAAWYGEFASGETLELGPWLEAQMAERGWRMTRVSDWDAPAMVLKDTLRFDKQ